MSEIENSSAEAIISAAENTLTDAKNRREAERRGAPPGEKQRNERITRTIHKINVAMIDVRALIGRAQWYEVMSDDAEHRLRTVSEDLQYERRQLKKMLRHRMRPEHYST